MDTITIAGLVLMLLVGAGLGWLAGSRPAAEWRRRHAERDAEARELDAKHLRTFADLEAARVRADRADTLEGELRDLRAGHDAALTRQRDAHDRALAELRGENGALTARLARLESEAAEREKAAEARFADRQEQFERELARLTEAEEKLQAKFNKIGEDLLKGAQEKFLEGAGHHLSALSKDSLSALEKHTAPIGKTLDEYRRRVEELEKGRAEAWHQLQGVIGEVKAGQQEVIVGARELTTSIRGGTKTRGDWGEIQFENLLESCNLRDKTDFRREVGVKGEDGNDLRPDAVINIPGGHKLIVDVKNVHNTFREANEAADEEQRSVLLAKHAKEVRGHVAALSAKRYQDRVAGSAEFVVMFVPGEHVLYAALMQDDGLLNYALERGVVLSSPLNFMSIALTVATMWRQAAVQADADEIAQLGKALYDRLGIVARYMSNLRRDLGKANDSFDKLVGSFDKNLRRTGERFQALESVDTSAKELTEALPLGQQPRRLANFPEDDGEDASASDLPARAAR